MLRVYCADSALENNYSIHNVLWWDVGQVNGRLKSDLAITPSAHSQVRHMLKFVLWHRFQGCQIRRHPVCTLLVDLLLCLADNGDLVPLLHVLLGVEAVCEVFLAPTFPSTH